MYQTMVFSAVAIGIVSALFGRPIIAAGAFVAAGLFAIADAIKTRQL